MLKESESATSDIVGIVATVTEKERLHHTLVPNHGQHEFQFVETLKRPEKVQRLESLIIFYLMLTIFVVNVIGFAFSNCEISNS